MADPRNENNDAADADFAAPRNENNDDVHDDERNENIESAVFRQSSDLFWSRINTMPFESLRKINNRTAAMSYEHPRTTPPHNCFKEYLFQELPL